MDVGLDGGRVSAHPVPIIDTSFETNADHGTVNGLKSLRGQALDVVLQRRLAGHAITWAEPAEAAEKSTEDTKEEPQA